MVANVIANPTNNENNTNTPLSSSPKPKTWFLTNTVTSVTKDVEDEEEEVVGIVVDEDDDIHRPTSTTTNTNHSLLNIEGDGRRIALFEEESPEKRDVRLVPNLNRHRPQQRHPEPPLSSAPPPITLSKERSESTSSTTVTVSKKNEDSEGPVADKNEKLENESSSGHVPATVKNHPVQVKSTLPWSSSLESSYSSIDHAGDDLDHKNRFGEEELSSSWNFPPSNKLYGRDKEQALLEKAFERILAFPKGETYQQQQQQPEKMDETLLTATHVDTPSTPKKKKSLEYVLISGGCGSGKTRLASFCLQRSVQERNGFLCYGKFDQQQFMADPLAPLKAAFLDFVHQVMASGETKVAQVRQDIQAALSPSELPGLYKMLPPLAEFIGDLNAETTITPSKEGIMTDTNIAAPSCGCYENDPLQDTTTATNNSRGTSMLALRKLMRAICSPEQPLVMILDDLQWASKCPLDSLRYMLLDEQNDGIMFLGICSHDNTSPNSELAIFLRKLEDDDGVTISNIHLRNLSLNDIEDLVMENFPNMSSEKQAKALAKFVYENSQQGNVYFAVESLKMFQQDSRLLHYDETSNEWTANYKACERGVGNYCPKVFMERKLKASPRDMQKVFMVASCLGSCITERLVETALQEPVEDRLEKIRAHGKMVYDEVEKTYTFRHNWFQTACYNLIGQELQPAFHLEIGLRLWKHLDDDNHNNNKESELEQHIFIVLNQLKKGSTLMRDQSMRYDAAALAIRAAEKAAASFSFSTASSCLQFAFSLLGPNHWDEAYELSLVLYNYAAEVEFSVSSDSDRVDYLIEETLKHVPKNNCLDKIRAYSTQMYVLSVRGKMHRSIEIGIDALKMLNVHLRRPLQCPKFSLALGMILMDRKLRGKSDQSIKRLPPMTDRYKLAAMQILNLLFLNTYLAQRDLFPFVVLKMMKLTLDFGMSSISSVGFAGYGTLLAFSCQVEEGLRFGTLALDLVDELNARSFQSRVWAFVWGSIVTQVRPWTESLDPLEQGHLVGLQTGDTEFAMLNAHLVTVLMVDTGKFTFEEMHSRICKIKEWTELHGHKEQLGTLNPFLAGLEMFNDPNRSLVDHSGKLDDGLEEVKKNGNVFGIAILFCTKLFFYFVAGDHRASMEMLEERYAVLGSMDGSIHETFALYVGGLSFFGAFRNADVDGSKNTNHHQQLSKRKLLKRARRSMRLLRALAKLNPTECLGKLVLLEAENAALSNKDSLVTSHKYSHAISLATKYGSHFELAFANQVAADHYIVDLNDIAKGIYHLKEASKAYERWGGRAAVSHLTTRIAQLEASGS